jgi:1-acyl-sn-glycerol-3-phosphate acyltransferase
MVPVCGAFILAFTAAVAVVPYTVWYGRKALAAKKHQAYYITRFPRSPGKAPPFVHV